MPSLRKPRLLKRGLVDKYYVVAFIALLLYVMVVTSVAWTIEAHILSSHKVTTVPAPPSLTNASAISYKAVNEMDLVRAGLDFAQRGIEAGWRAFSVVQLPAAQLAAIDLAFLLKVHDANSPSLIVGKLDALMRFKEKDGSTDEHIGLLLSLASIFETQRYHVQASACRERIDHLLKTHDARASLDNLKMRNHQWPAEAATGVGIALHLISGERLHGIQGEVDTVQSLLENNKTHILSRAYAQAEHWELPEGLHWSVAYPSARVGGPSTLSESTLKYLELLLGLWLLGDKKDAALRDAYEKGVEGLLTHLMGTATHTTNHTFVYYWGPQGKVPLQQPESCAAAGVLARGIKHHMHRYPKRGDALRYRDEDILATAEAIAASCYQLYWGSGKEVDGNQAAYMEQDFVVLLRTSKKRCTIRKTLLRNCYELYEVTEDPMYAAWALRLMRMPNEGCYPATARELLLPSTYSDYIEELRYFTFLFQSMRCKLYKNSLKSDRTCKMWPGALVTKKGHLLHLEHAISSLIN